jgi:hypothetical protein
MKAKKLWEKVAARFSSCSFLRPYCSFLRLAPTKATSSGASATIKSSNTAMKASEKYAASYFLRLACLGLCVAGFLWTQESSHEHARIHELLQKGWVWLDQSPCANATEEGFYELSAEERSVEFLRADGKILASTENLPEPPYQCSPILEPNFIQEI